MRYSVATIERLRTIGLISTLALGLSAAPLPVEAQQAGKVYRIGYLTFVSGDTCTSSSSCTEVRQGLRKLGYVEGQNLVIEYRSAKGKLERLPEVAAELVRLKVDVIVTSGSPRAIRAAKRATRTIPIVMPGGTVDPVEAGFVDSLARRLPESILVDPEIFPVALSRTKSITIDVEPHVHRSWSGANVPETPCQGTVPKPRLSSKLVVERGSLKGNHGLFREFEPLIGTAT